MFFRPSRVCVCVFRQHILGTLRLCDLQDFLQEFGQTKSGRKHDLVRRCQNTLQQVSPEKALTKLKNLSRRGRRGGVASPLPAPRSQWTAYTAPEPAVQDSIAPFVESPFYEHVACITPPTPLGECLRGYLMPRSVDEECATQTAWRCVW